MSGSCFNIKGKDAIVNKFKKDLKVDISEDALAEYLNSLLHSISTQYNLKIFNEKDGSIYPESLMHINRALCITPEYSDNKEEVESYNNLRDSVLAKYKGESISDEDLEKLKKEFGYTNVLYIDNNLIIRPKEYKTKQEQVIAFMDSIQNISKESIGNVWNKTINSKLNSINVTSPTERYKITHPEESNIPKQWKNISSWIGSEIDSLCKDYFQGIEGNYPNLPKSMREDIKEMLNAIKTKFPNAKFYSRDIALYGTFRFSRGADQDIVGEPDLIIVDEKGDIHIVDFKTARSRSDEKTKKYSEQLYYYENMLREQSKTLGFNNVSIDTAVQYIDISYVAPTNAEGPLSYYKDENGVIYFKDENNNDWTLSNMKEFKIVAVDNSFEPINVEKIENIAGWVDTSKATETVSSPKVTGNSIYSLLLGNIVSRSRINSETTFIAKTFSSIIDDVVFLVTSDTVDEDIFIDVACTLNKSDEELNNIIEALRKINNSVGINVRTAIIEQLGGVTKILNTIKNAFYNDFVDDSDIAIYNNFEALALLANSKIKFYEQLSSTGLDNSLTEVLNYMDESTRVEFENTEENSRESWQIAVEHLSAKSSLSKDIRRILGKIKKKDAEDYEIYDDYYRPKYVDENEVFNALLTWLQGCKNGDEMISILESHLEDMESDGTKSSVWIEPLLGEINKEPIKSLFYQNFKKESKKYSTVVWIPSKKTFAVKMINTSSMFENIYDEFAYNISNGTSVLAKGNNSIRGLKDKVQKTEVSKNIDPENIARNIIDILGELGIRGYIGKGEGIVNLIKSGDSGIEAVRSVLNNINTMLGEALKTKSKITNINDFDSTNYIRNFISPIASVIRSEVEACCYENGKLYYSFVPPSYMGELIGDLKGGYNRLSEDKYIEFLESEYNSEFFGNIKDTNNCFWLNRLYNDTGDRNILDFKTQIHFNKVNYKDQDPATYTLSLMSEYYNNNSKNAWYRVPIVSNKPAAEFIKFKKFEKYDIIDSLGILAINEIKRIKTVLYRWANNKESIQNFDIKDPENTTIDFKAIKQRILNNSFTVSDLLVISDICKASGASFKFLPILNNALFNEETNVIQEEIIKFLNNNSTETINLDSLNFNLKVTINNSLKEEIEKEKQQLEKLGLLEIEERTSTVDGKVNKSFSYKRLNSIGIVESSSSKEGLATSLYNFISDYIYNEVWATANIIMLSVSDLALYKNNEDFQKRYAQVHANSLRLNTTATFTNKEGKEIRYSDGKHRCIYLKDREIPLNSTISAVKSIYDRWIQEAETNKDEGRSTYLKVARDNMVKALNKVNTTDGQAFTSITGFRKKRGMAGRWSENDELAYQRVLSGDATDISDLLVSWSVTKPFQYSQIFKNSGVSGAGVINNIKIGVQYKNSEYVLVMADALLRSQNESSELTELFDFLESTHKDINSNYKDNGIDTIQFESCVKTGLMGPIDIFNREEGSSITDILNFYTKDADGNYREEYVHETPFSDWGIQQEVPDHLKDHYQAIGSQVRILGISDINNSELQEEYQKINAQNIHFSYEDVIEEFELNDKSPQKRKEALSKILTDEIMRNLERYGTDLLVACSLNSNGDFNIPLGDFLNSTRIQQLLNSIIKSRIYKQKISGGPTVQVSCFGYSDNCNIRYKDSNGNILPSKKEYKAQDERYTDKDFYNMLKEKAASIAYMEAFISVPSEKMRKDLIGSDGKLVDVEKAIKDGIIKEDHLKAIGYRIPTEDKYSMQPIKIVGFFPSTTESIILPDELPAITGADFDIDKIYLMRKEYEVNDQPLNYNLLKTELKNKLDNASDSNNVSMTSIKDVLGSFKENISVLGYYRALETLRIVTDIQKERVQKALYDLLSESSGKYISLYKEFTRSTKKGNYTKEERRAIRALNNNRIIDIQFEVLTNTEASLQLLSPGNFDTLKRQSKIIRALSVSDLSYNELSKLSNKELDNLLNSEVLNPLTPSTQRYFQSQNMTAAKLIGIFANHNVSHAFVSMQDINLANTKHNIQLGNAKISNGSKLDNVINNQGNYVSKVIAEFLSASVDAVKDPVLNHMNINATTSGVAMLLARLGSDIETICLLLSSKVIRDVVTGYEIVKGNKEYIPLKDIINNKIVSLGGTVQEEVVSVISKEDLAEAIKSGDKDIDILNVFSALHEMTSDLTELVHCTKYNSINNAVGPNISNTTVNQNRVESFIERAGKGSTIFNEKSANIISNSPILSAFYDSSYGIGGLSVRLLGDHFPHWNSNVKEALDTIEKSIKGRLKPEDIDLIIADLMHYIYIKDALYSDSNLYKEYIEQFPKVIDIYKQQFTNNKLLQALKFNTLSTGIPYLTTKLNNLDNNIKENIQSDWEDLWGIVIKDTGTSFDNTANLGKSLFIYFTLRSGFTYSPTIPTHLASTKMKMREQNDTYYYSLTNFDAINVAEFVDLFIRNNTHVRKFVTKFKPKDPVVNTSENSNDIVIKLTKGTEDYYKLITEKTASKEDTFVRYILYNDSLYVLTSSKSGAVNSNEITLSYRKTSFLGVSNKFKEYIVNGDSAFSRYTAKSAIEEEEIGMTEEDFLEARSEGLKLNTNSNTISLKQQASMDELLESEDVC